jgi:hypothetical protein
MIPIIIYKINLSHNYILLIINNIKFYIYLTNKNKYAKIYLCLKIILLKERVTNLIYEILK